MEFTKNVRQIKALFLLIAFLIAISFLYISNLLVKDLSTEEKNKVEVWAEAMRAMNLADENTDMNLVLKVLNANNTIPVIVVDAGNNIQLYRNIIISSSDTLSYLERKLDKFEQLGQKIRIINELPAYSIADNGVESDYIDVYYDESLILKRLSVYPYIQLLVVLIFVGVVLFALLNFKKAEQNKVWVGLSKETAHQLGTPVSSLMAWLELLKAKYPSDDLIPAMSDDVFRLQMITNRFSKIGATPEIEETSLSNLLEDVINYLYKRISNKVEIIKEIPDHPVAAKINSPLLGWVIENMVKNAVDAMEGIGTITISLLETTHTICIDISDTGKGIPKDKHKTIFSPGYTTKKKGWGLGLSLVRRIVEEYHSGRVFVKDSEVNKGTTFRIELKK